MGDVKRASKANARQSDRHKGRYGAYLTRSTCTTCKIVFRSPKYRLSHVESDHRSLVGKANGRVVKTYESIFGKF